jgi:hypothetical protein
MLQLVSEWLLFNDKWAIFQSSLCSLFLISLCFTGEASYTNSIVFGLTQPWLEPTIYNIKGEHASHYTIYAILEIIRYGY